MIISLEKNMLGAIIGDVVGSKYEFDNIKSKDFPLFSKENKFTDGTVLTCAIAQACMNCKGDYSKLQKEAKKCLLEFGRIYMANNVVGYGEMFYEWLKDPMPYQSFGNGAAMRVSPLAYFAKDKEQLKEMSRAVTILSHNHVEAITGAEAVAVSVFMALNGASKEEIKKEIEKNYYKLNFDYEKLVKSYRFDVSCKNSVPQAIFCFLISDSFEDALRTAISIGGDSDTIACITCSIAEAFYGVPVGLERWALRYLDKNLLTVYRNFCKSKYCDYAKIHGEDMLKDFNFSDFVKRRKRFLKENSEKSFVIVEGQIPLIISSPHGVSQVRLGQPKYAEPGSLSLALELQKRTNAHLIAKTKNCNDDANFDAISPYKEELKRYIKQHNIKYLIDFHGMKKSREIDINLGTNFGRNIMKDEKLFDFLLHGFNQRNFKVAVDNPFNGDADTVSGAISQSCGIWTIQIEINYRFTNEKRCVACLLDILEIMIQTIDFCCKGRKLL